MTSFATPTVPKQEPLVGEDEFPETYPKRCERLYQEARAIVAGTTRMLADREHLEVLLSIIDWQEIRIRTSERRII